MVVRSVNKEDLPALKKIIDSTEMFPSEMLDEMIEPYFSDPSTDIWLTKEIDQTPIAIAYCAPEKMTSGTFNLYLIAVDKAHQGTGIGTEIINHLEELLKKRSARILIVETSGLPEFEKTRGFYKRQKFVQEATIRDFYQDGEDKIVFWKNLK
eukprot:TRINITY_DN537_c0_g1_i1.p1 TRINITY_DN537_c0_g1~~TRINITY_DN537_c0_g1_i1.p1  ORF type:complete len:153 (-),score=41.01 TRINITY_DN537_c0_g1_i1:48-506(-)